MENAVDALYMAAAVLIFVLALSISINAFGEVRVAANQILSYKDSEYNTDYISGGDTTRTVNLETIVPTLYKAYAENNKVVFSESLIGSEGLYQIRQSLNSAEITPIFTFDLNDGNTNLANRTVAMEFIKGILYGKNAIDDEIENILENNRIYLNNTGIYDKIKDRRITEKIGLYYQGAENEDEVFDVDNVDVTKIKRVISYS